VGGVSGRKGNYPVWLFLSEEMSWSVEVSLEILRNPEWVRTQLEEDKQTENVGEIVIRKRKVGYLRKRKREV